MTNKYHFYPSVIPGGFKARRNLNQTWEEVQEIISRAMKSGVLKQRNAVGVVTGLMGSGKTCLLDHLFFEPIPELYSSTGVFEQSKRGLLHHVGHMATNEWKNLSHEGIRKFLAPAIKGGLNEADVVQLSKDIVQPEVSPVSPEEPQPLSSLVSAAAKPPEHLPPLPDKSLTGHELHSLVNRAEGAKIEVLELAHMIDTGGQPELMEVMPCLVHNANLAIMVVNLVYGLDDYPKLNFHEKG